MVGTMVLVLMGCGSAVFNGGCGTPAQVLMVAVAIGLSLVLVHVVCIPITGTSVNPARSIAPALFEGGAALSQLWLFVVAPFVGACLSAAVWKLVGGERS